MAYVIDLAPTHKTRQVLQDAAFYLVTSIHRAMDSIIKRAESHRSSCWIEIPDVGCGGARLHLVNGGMGPQTPDVGDFTYDFKNSTVQVFDTDDSWRTVTTREIESWLRHPTRNRCVASFTHRGLPFWTSADEEVGEREFATAEDILETFRQRCDPAKVHVAERPSESSCCSSWLVVDRGAAL